MNKYFGRFKWSFEWEVEPQTAQLTCKTDNVNSWNPIILSDEVLYILSNEKWNHKHHINMKNGFEIILFYA